MLRSLPTCLVLVAVSAMSLLVRSRAAPLADHSTYYRRLLGELVSRGPTQLENDDVAPDDGYYDDSDDDDDAAITPGDVRQLPTSDSAVEDDDGAEPAGLTAISKRLMGLFRCSGWGPSCTGGGGYASAATSRYNTLADKLLQQQQKSRRRKHHRSSGAEHQAAAGSSKTVGDGSDWTADEALNGGVSLPVGGGGAGTRRQAAKFEPFFALTSGGSWGPAGRKRRES